MFESNRVKPVIMCMSWNPVKLQPVKRFKPGNCLKKKTELASMALERV